MEKNSDDVSNIHNQVFPYTHQSIITLLFLVVSLIIAAAITIITYLGYLGSEEFLFRIPLVVGILAITQLIDTRFTKKKEYSKSLHASLLEICYG